MAKTINRLSETQYKLTSINAANTWVTENLNVTNSGTSTFRPNGYKQLEMSIIDPDLPNALEINGLTLFETDENIEIILTFAVRMASGGSVSVVISETNLGINEVSQTFPIESTNSVFATSSIVEPVVSTVEWSIIRTNSIVVPISVNSPTLNISISFEPVDDTEIFYFTSPFVAPNYDMFLKNAAIVPIMQNLPFWIVQQDLELESTPNVQLSRLIDIGSSYIDKAIEYVFAYRYVDIEDGFNISNPLTISRFTDPSQAAYPVLLYLSAFVFTSPVTRFESAEDYLPEPFILDESNLDEETRLLLTTITSITPPTITRNIQLELLRWQIQFGYYGANAGTMNAVIEAAKQMLTGEKQLTVNFDWDVEPWVINIESPWDQTFGADEELIGTGSSLVLQAVSYAKPLGVLVNHNITAAV